MPSEKQAYEGASVPVRGFVLAAACGFIALLICLAAVFGLYTVWVNGPQAPVRPAPLANRAAPALETEQFREPAASRQPDPKAAAQGYRWRDAAHNRVEIPIERAMAMTAARNEEAFDPAEGAAPATPGDGR